ncbi:hypothetical protein KY495_11690 [Massilia sp. PAMC28688]|uniref:hypothetical protein n=1 Tax=Massilia sp. PAMC28688 TaxID=2861283 RepID=UPI001C631BDE|nr:hypothetical protein [Massilia sp. PAMC28688]QYF95752.1 hypothetical protein KY495_11690 [Massilia sp. PAMC28688]
MLDLVQIPTLLAGAIVAAVTSALIALFNDFRATKKLHSEQGFAAGASKVAREYALRSEIYLPLAVACDKIMSSLPFLPDDREQDRKSMTEYSECSSKLLVVAESPTALRLLDLNEKLSEELATLSILARDVREKAAGLISATEGIASARAEVHSVALEVTSEKDSPSSEALAERIHKATERAFDNLQHQHTLKTFFTKARAKAKRAYFSHLRQILPELTDNSARLVIALRGEMALKTDEAAFLERHRSSCRKLCVMIDDIVARATEAEQQGH